MEALVAPLSHLGFDARLVAAGSSAHGDLVVVDSYRHRADDRSLFHAPVIAAVDDLCRGLRVDVVVDPNPRCDDEVYPAAGRVLGGPRFALVPPLKYGPHPDAGREVRAVLVTAGAADAGGIGASIAARLAGLLGEGFVRLVIGPWGSTEVPAGVAPVVHPDGLENELGRADLVVTAGGVTMLEAMRLGRPVVAVITADNQRRAVRGAADAGAIIETGASTAADIAAELVHDRPRRLQLAARAARYIDGEGGARVAAALDDVTISR
jgi:spore coat polysaccharide biosynthesis predicted glycosyltransferase SpsG